MEIVGGPAVRGSGLVRGVGRAAGGSAQVQGAWVPLQAQIGEPTNSVVAEWLLSVLPWERWHIFLVPGGCGQRQGLEERQAGGGGSFGSVALQIRAKEKVPPVRTGCKVSCCMGTRVSGDTPPARWGGASEAGAWKG